MQEAYVIGSITVKDDVKWAEYRSKVPDTLVPWGGELVFRGQKLKELSGNNRHSGNVIIRFPSSQALSNWFESDAYQALIPIRELAAEMDLISYEATG
uniref:DUF1330 domain-containing protein n=1 Tax=uncultured Thiotrichaceae bacterium TaxID=298394 RepID=A0A6S6UK08_9GAMM|nr:MAG: DUF1330 domain-containing protein [uncultured Thiotrichaceae bacterium]